ncbi:MAG: DUF86 domain-containing protein [Bdellovibrionales bacterium]
MTKDWTLYALHILDCTAKIRRIVTSGLITEDDILYDAVLRNLQTLSEATQHLPEDKIRKQPQIPWKEIRGFRNILVHDYLGEIDSQTVLNVIKIHLAPLEIAIRNMLEQEKTDEH